MKKIRRHETLFINVIFLVGFMILVYCGKEAPTTPKKNVLDWIYEGWEQFEAKQYVEATNSFNNAITLLISNPNDSIAAIAYCGFGWSQMRLQEYDVALNNFSISIQKNIYTPGPYVLHSYVGRAGILYMKNLYNEAIRDVNEVLKFNGNYEFSHDTRIKFTDLHFLLAEAYYNILEYSKAQEKVDILRNFLGLPPINWNRSPIVVDGVAYKTYHEALLKAIEGLRNKV